MQHFNFIGLEGVFREATRSSLVETHPALRCGFKKAYQSISKVAKVVHDEPCIYSLAFIQCRYAG